MSVYRSPSSSDNDTFIAELTVSLNEAVNKFDNLIVMGDFNIDIKKKIAQDLINWKSYVVRLISQT